MRDDAVIRVPRAAWGVARVFADRTGQKMREIAAAALNEYVKRENEKAK